MNRTQLIFVFVLLGIAAVVIIANTLSKQRTPSPGTSSESAQTPSASPPEAASLSLEERERIALSPLAQDASIEEKERHFAIAQSIAQVAPYLDITECETPNPLVLKVKSGEALLVINEGSVAHTISIGGEQVFSIVANSRKSIQPNFREGPWLYGYGCDNSSYEVGLFFVTP